MPEATVQHRKIAKRSCDGDSRRVPGIAATATAAEALRARGEGCRRWEIRTSGRRDGICSGFSQRDVCSAMVFWSVRKVDARCDEGAGR
jgi:hypothetical protein